ncbi:MAG: hypothetical protein WA964_16740 [Ilumatobacter sp.]|uniref:hypothetical protein n=1 Tax=Ilumatobacter sp. TaxID=1967498 RepID=UPI003C7689C6
MSTSEKNEEILASVDSSAEEDKGAILVFVLVVITVMSLIALPMLSYTSAVMRSGTVQSNRAQAIEFANGGTWALLANGSDLYDICNGSNLAVPLDGVTTSCDVLDTNTLRPDGEMPFEVATVQADRPIPAAFVNTDIAASGFQTTYTNPNTSADPAAWLTNVDWTAKPEAGKVWVPQLPVQATSEVVDAVTSDRITDMLPGTQDPLYSSCKVFFPGTYNTPIVIDSPAYFTSGVYSFNQPITLRDGADVVVGNGQGFGCTTDFEAISSATDVPDPLNMSGLGGTFVLGDRGRIIVDDDGSGEIRFVINQRYVSDDETGVKASSDVAIVSVNGQHEPLLAGEAVGDDFLVSGISSVPASKIGIEGEPEAVDRDYLPSVYTAKPGAPDAPIVTSAQAWRNGTCNTCGWLRVDWTVPNENGALITAYTATDSASGQSCSPKTPTLPDTTVQPTCTITGISDNTTTSVTVTATNELGTSDPSGVFAGPTVRPSSSPRSTQAAYPTRVRNLSGTSHSDGFEVTWDSPLTESGAAPFEFRVSVTPTAGGSTIQCVAWWDEDACVVPTSAGLVAATEYRIVVRPIIRDGTTGGEFVNAPTETFDVVFDPASASSNAPVQVAATAGPRIITPILDFTTDTSTDMEIVIDGYVSVPQGRILVSATSDPAGSSVEMSGGVLAGDLDIEPATAPTPTSVFFDNPVAQKRVQISSSYDGKARATSSAVVQVNRSGSLAINSWVVQ